MPADVAAPGPPAMTMEADDVVLRAHGPAGTLDATAIYERYGRMLRRIARRILNDADAAEDVVQDVVMYAWIHPERFDPDRGSLFGWLSVMTRRRAFDRVRQETARSARERHVTMGSARVADDGQGGLGLMSSIELFDVIRQLPSEQVAVLILVYVGGWSHREVAASLHLPLGTVKSRIRLGLRRLTVVLAEQEQQARG